IGAPARPARRHAQGRPLVPGGDARRSAGLGDRGRRPRAGQRPGHDHGRRGRRDRGPAPLPARGGLPAGPGLPPRAPGALRGDDRAAPVAHRRLTYAGPVEVYGTARGPLARLADPLAARARERRHDLFRRLTGVTPATRIVDVGCGTAGLRALAPGLDVTGVDLVDRPAYPGPFVRADRTDRLPFADGPLDLAYSNSVIEHVPVQRRAAF